MYYALGGSFSSLHRESTDSLIYRFGITLQCARSIHVANMYTDMEISYTYSQILYHHHQL